MQKNETAKSTKEIVMEYIDALQRKDWKTVRSYISDDISVVAPGPGPSGLTTFKQAEPYMNYLQHGDPARLEIKKVFTDSNDVCLLFDVTYRESVTGFVCAWIHVNDDGRISSVRFVTDPRPFFQ
jgi:ketosteroid isomerase-like protein